ncbi:MAG TPA: peptidase E [Alphaproteobacteria bacterium]|nr:peptidase E [Alphaproteobacteria bacterium]
MTNITLATKTKRVRRAIVAIGGGNIRTRGTLAIDREIIRLSNKRHPKLLFIPTASSDSEKYWQHVDEYFGGFLQCKTDVLFLIKEHPSQQQIRKKILSADIVYVGGGNTLKMMRLWRRFGVDKVLKAAYARGTVLCGISAGSICWFESGHSDSLAFYNPKNWKYINVSGMGLIEGIHCPHYNSRTLGEPRRKLFREMIGKVGGVGIAIQDNCALELMDGKFYRVITSKSYSGAYKVYRKRGQVLAEKIPQETRFTPIHLLLDRSRSGL